MSDTARLATALGDRYVIERELGAGGMATVYLARDLKHDREVALKVLRPELAFVVGEGKQRFLQEIHITARLDHPHILTLIDSGEAGGFLYYILPYVPGESLRDRLDRERQLPVGDAVRIATQVALALDYAHRRGIVHRDIKPENVLLHEGEAMVADFGIALAVRESGGLRFTQSGMSLGTPQYMSPEQATSDQLLDARSDIYSLGAILYEMLTGEVPHTGPTMQAILAKMLTARPTHPRVLRDTVPAGLSAAVLKALERSPADRFASAADFAEALTRPDGASPASGPWPRRMRIAVAGMALVALGAAAWVVLHGRSVRSRSYTPQLEQLTTDGDARFPALSPDGTRLAYVARECGVQAHCAERLVVRDTGGAGAITVLSGSEFTAVQWATGGRFLVAVLTDTSGRTGAFAAPALGGTPRFLGCCRGSVVGTTDTMLLGRGYSSASDSVTWLRLLTVSDGVVRDSVPVGRPGLVNTVRPAPVGDRIAVFSWTHQSVAIRLMDRAGRVTDSLSGINWNDFGGLFWAPRADALLWVLSPGAALAGVWELPQRSFLLRRRVTADGRFARGTDTLLQLQPGSRIAEVRPDGTALLSQGPIDAAVYAMERPRAGRLNFHTRRLVSSTAGLQAGLSRDGAVIWLLRKGEGAGSTRRDAFLPFAGGEERPFTAPRGDVLGTDWTRPASTSLLLAVRDSAGHARLFEVAVAAGQTKEIAEPPDRDGFIFAFSIPGGGLAFVNNAMHSARVRDRPGKADTTWSVPAAAGRFAIPADVAPDGRAFISITLSAAADTVWVARVPLDGSASSPLATIPRTPGFLFAWLPDGSVEYVAREAAAKLRWYRVPPGGGPAVRLGDAPLQGSIAWSPMSDDGRRVVAVKSVDRPDVYLIRNFAELLRR